LPIPGPGHHPPTYLQRMSSESAGWPRHIFEGGSPTKCAKSAVPEFSRWPPSAAQSKTLDFGDQSAKVFDHDPRRLRRTAGRFLKRTPGPELDRTRFLLVCRSESGSVRAQRARPVADRGRRAGPGRLGRSPQYVLAQRSAGRSSRSPPSANHRLPQSRSVQFKGCYVRCRGVRSSPVTLADSEVRQSLGFVWASKIRPVKRPIRCLGCGRGLDKHATAPPVS
jgi:hypothetical protein